MRVVIVVPGIMGSTLFYGRSGIRRRHIWSDRLWDNYANLLSNPGLLSWTGRPADAELIETFYATRAHLPVRSLWRRVLEFFGRHPEFGQGGCVLKVGYDWRQSLVDSSQDLVTKIDDHLARRFPDISSSDVALTFVTHSMGGLLVRAAIGVGQLPADRIDRIIHVGSPLEGAADAFYAAFGGPRLPLLRELSRFIQWRNSHQFWGLLKSAVQTFPSIYEVMPFPGNNFLSYTPSRRENPFDARFPSYIPPQFLASARAFHGVMRAAEQNIRHNRVRVYTVLTEHHSQCRTDTAYLVRAVAAPGPTYEVIDVIGSTSLGDGTVVADSARGDPISCAAIPVLNVTHAAMCNDKNVVRALQTLL